MLRDAGFVDVVEEHFKWPTNAWPEDEHLKELGMWQVNNQRAGMEGASLAIFTRWLGWSVGELRGFLGELRGEMEDGNVHAYWPV
jgi:hypothetical protein